MFDRTLTKAPQRQNMRRVIGFPSLFLTIALACLFPRIAIADPALFTLPCYFINVPNPCAGQETLPKTSVGTTSADFGLLLINDTRRESAGGGGVPMTVSNIRLAGADAQHFQVTSPDCL